MSQDKTELVNQALGGLLDATIEQNYAGSLSAIFQLAGLLGEKWLAEYNIELGSPSFDEKEAQKRKNENISNAIHLLGCMQTIKEELSLAILEPKKHSLINKTAYYAFYMGMTFGYLNPDFVQDHNYIDRGRKNKKKRQETQRRTVEKITAWHGLAKAAYFEIKAAEPKLKSARKIATAINTHYTIPGMMPGALYDLVLKWEKAAPR